MQGEERTCEPLISRYSLVPPATSRSDTVVGRALKPWSPSNEVETARPMFVRLTSPIAVDARACEMRQKAVEVGYEQLDSLLAWPWRLNAPSALAVVAARKPAKMSLLTEWKGLGRNRISSARVW